MPWKRQGYHTHVHNVISQELKDPMQIAHSTSDLSSDRTNFIFPINFLRSSPGVSLSMEMSEGTLEDTVFVKT
jgi:hypothetical protein